MARKLSAILRRKPRGRALRRSGESPRTPTERWAKLKKEAGANRIQPLTAEEFDRFMNRPSAWPEGDDFEAFLRWRRETRGEDRT